MALGARLELRQGQSLVITPQLQQAIKLLQLSNLELETFVELELEKNPLLAREEPVAEAEPPSEAASDETYVMMDEPGRRRRPRMSAGPSTGPRLAGAAALIKTSKVWKAPISAKRRCRIT